MASFRPSLKSYSLVPMGAVSKFIEMMMLNKIITEMECIVDHEGWKQTQFFI